MPVWVCSRWKNELRKGRTEKLPSPARMTSFPDRLINGVYLGIELKTGQQEKGLKCGMFIVFLIFKKITAAINT